MARLLDIRAPAHGRRTGFNTEDVRTRTTLPERAAGRGLSLRHAGRTRAFRPAVPCDRTMLPGIGAGGIHRGAKPVLQCLSFGRNALRRCGRTATEARVRSSIRGFQFFRLNRSVGAGVRTRDRMINSHLLYLLSYPRCHKRPESNRCLPGFQTGALHELHPASSHGGTRHRTPVRASRDLREPEPKSATKERADKVSAARWQVHFANYF